MSYVCLYKQEGDSSGKEQHSLVKTACVNLKDLRLYRIPTDAPEKMKMQGNK